MGKQKRSEYLITRARYKAIKAQADGTILLRHI